MSAIRFLVGVGVVTVPAFASAAPQQSAPVVAPGTAQAAATMGVAECAQAQPQLMQTLDAANMRLEAARQNNSPAAMRAAMDDLQGALGSLRAQLAPCAALQAAAPADPHAGHAMPVAGNLALIKDPGCTATVNSETAPRAEHAGQNYYFCSERDRQLFVTDPVNYLQSPTVGQTVPAVRTPTRPSAGSRPAAPRAPAAADPHAGMVMPGAARPTAPAGTSGAGHTATALSSGRMPVIAMADLKCQSRPDPRTTPRMLYGGRMYYFCSVAERAEFAKSPEKYVNAPASETAPAHGH
jgi:YHS domain-containing protein